MLQQTQVETVIPYYERFILKFPTVDKLAKAPLQQVLKVWENLGYYSRARNLHRAARVVMKEMHGVFPSSHDGLLRLPGIGPYIAGAILSIAFNKKVPAVDGNVKRVFSRLFLIREALDDAAVKRKIQDLAEEMVPEKDSALFNQGIMDLGASICRPKNPQCSICPIKRQCLAYENNLQDKLPIILKRRPIPHKEITAGIIFNKKKQLLIVQRPNHGLLAGLWKFPGGVRSEKDRDLTQALRRTIREEVGLNVRIGRSFQPIKHAYTHFKITLFAFRCARRSGDPRTLGCQNRKWIRRNELQRFPFSKVDRKIIEML